MQGLPSFFSPFFVFFGYRVLFFFRSLRHIGSRNRGQIEHAKNPPEGTGFQLTPKQVICKIGDELNSEP